MKPETTLFLVLLVGIVLQWVTLMYLMVSHASEREKAGVRWAAILNDLSMQFSKDLAEVATTKFRQETAVPPSAIHIPQADDAEARATREITEQVKQAGIGSLREQYREMNMARTDEQLEAEVEAVMAGRAVPI